MVQVFDLSWIFFGDLMWILLFIPLESELEWQLWALKVLVLLSFNWKCVVVYRALADQLCSIVHVCNCTSNSINASTWDPTPWFCYSRWVTIKMYYSNPCSFGRVHQRADSLWFAMDIDHGRGSLSLTHCWGCLAWKGSNVNSLRL
jgi:hypothetical protein